MVFWEEDVFCYATEQYILLIKKAYEALYAIHFVELSTSSELNASRKVHKKRRLINESPLYINMEYFKKKGQAYSIAPLQPPTLAAFRPWGIQ